MSDLNIMKKKMSDWKKNRTLWKKKMSDLNIMRKKMSDWKKNRTLLKKKHQIFIESDKNV